MSPLFGMNTEKEKVVNCLVNFVERASKEGATPAEVLALTEVAKILLNDN